MFYIWKTILNGGNYQLDRCFLEIHDASYRDKFADLVSPDGFTQLSSGIFWWLINIQPGYLVFRQGNSCTVSLICLVGSPGSLVMTNCMLAIPTQTFASVKIYSKMHMHGITA